MNAFVALIEINPRSGFSKGVKPLALSKKEKKKKKPLFLSLTPACCLSVQLHLDATEQGRFCLRELGIHGAGCWGLGLVLLPSSSIKAAH